MVNKKVKPRGMIVDKSNDRTSWIVFFVNFESDVKILHLVDHYIQFFSRIYCCL